MEIFNLVVGKINGVLWGYVLIFLLIALGVYFTFVSKFMQFRLFGEMFRLIVGKVPALKDGEKKVKGQVSAFQAFCICVAAHVGTGNLAGVAIAIAIGGPGALFWMWLIALLGGATSLVENTLAQVYKIKDGDAFRGGPSYYMEKTLGLKKLAVFFSVIVILTFAFAFNSVQANTINLAFHNSFGLDLRIGGVIIAGLTALVIFGGLKRIANVVGYIVPIMALIYIFVAVIVLIINYDKIPALIVSIFEGAFGLKEVAGGLVGGTILQGVKRGLYSNEAGMGSAPNGAATSHVSHPAKQALMQAFGVFVDTLFVCSATGFIVLMYPDYAKGDVTGIVLTQTALAHSVGSWGTHFITLCIFLFAFSSLIGNYYYGETNLEFIKSDKKLMNIFRTLVILFIYWGCVAQLTTVWDLADLFMGTMALINIIVIAILTPKAMVVIRDYYRQKKEGKNPVFKAKDCGIENTECWD